MSTIETLTPAQAAKHLREMGMKISVDTLRLGLQQKVYPFGIYIDHDGSPVYQIFKRQFEEWVTERATP